MRPRDAVVLAAGLGTRMRPLTERIPKPALPFLNRPILHWVLDRLKASGVERVLLNLHHLPEAVRRAALAHGGLEVAFFPEPDILGTAGAFAPMASHLRDDVFLVVNGDAVFEADPAAGAGVLERHPDALAALALRPGSAAYTGLAVGGDGAVASFDGGPWMFAGCYAARRRLLDALIPGTRAELVKDLLAPRLGDGLIRSFSMDGFWADLGSPAAYLEATWAMLDRMGRGEAQVPAGSRLERRSGWPALLGEGASLDPSSVLTGPVVLGHGCRAVRGAVLGRAVLLEGAEAASGEPWEGVIAAPWGLCRA